jgi:hypothetical protein
MTVAMTLQLSGFEQGEKIIAPEKLPTAKARLLLKNVTGKWVSSERVAKDAVLYAEWDFLPTGRGNLRVTRVYQSEGKTTRDEQQSFEFRWEIENSILKYQFLKTSVGEAQLRTRYYYSPTSVQRSRIVFQSLVYSTKKKEYFVEKKVIFVRPV